MLLPSRLLRLSGNNRKSALKWLYISVCRLSKGLLDAHLMLAICLKNSPPECKNSDGELLFSIVVFEAVQRRVYLPNYYCGFIKVFFCYFGIFKSVKEVCHLLPKHLVSPRTAIYNNFTLKRPVYKISLFCLTRNSGQTLYLLIFLWGYPKGYRFVPPAIVLVQILL